MQINIDTRSGGVNSRTSGVYCGAIDWRHDSWGRWFYPADLPVDWRLTYFNTQFSCVWLPYATWRDAALEEVHGWVEDTRADFRFLLEAGPLPEPHELALLEILAPRMGLHCAADHADLVWFEKGVDLRNLARLLEGRARDDRAIYLLSRDGDQSTLEQVETLIGLFGLGPGAVVG